jgi:hypothetical protein
MSDPKAPACSPDPATPTCGTGVRGRAGFVVAQLRDLRSERAAVRAARRAHHVRENH